jgi:hypothetical protein
MATAVAPRVQTLVVCDGIRASGREENVFHLRGARSHVLAAKFPLRHRLRLFLVLSSPRPGRFPSHVKVMDDGTDQAVFYGQVDPAPVFPEAEVLLPLDLPVRVRFERGALHGAGVVLSGGRCRRPEDGTTIPHGGRRGLNDVNASNEALSDGSFAAADRQAHRGSRRTCRHRGAAEAQ